MYLVNFPALQNLQQQFIAADRFRTAQSLFGVKNGSNFTFKVPGTDKFTHNLPFLSIQVYFNGVRLTLLDDFTISEGGGVGTGYDTVILEVAPRLKDKIFADYVVTST